jgi:hypothetical protein
VESGEFFVGGRIFFYKDTRRLLFIGGIFMFKKGDRVVRIGHTHPLYEEVVAGLLGTVSEVLYGGMMVKWDNGLSTGCNVNNAQLVVAQNNAAAKKLLDKEW